MNLRTIANSIVESAIESLNSSHTTGHSSVPAFSSGAQLTEEEFWTIVGILSQPKTTQVLGANGVLLKEAM